MPASATAPPASLSSFGFAARALAVSSAASFHDSTARSRVRGVSFASGSGAIAATSACASAV
eukprot:33214-Prymnesium_polylepis.1